MELDEKSVGELLDEFLRIERYGKAATALSVKAAKSIKLDEIDPEIMYDFIKGFRVEKKKRCSSIQKEEVFRCCVGFRQICDNMKCLSQNPDMEFNIIFQRYLKKSGVMTREDVCEYLGISIQKYNRYRRNAVLNIIEAAELYKEDYLLNNSQGSNRKQ